LSNWKRPRQKVGHFCLVTFPSQLHEGACGPALLIGRFRMAGDFLGSLPADIDMISDTVQPSSARPAAAALRKPCTLQWDSPALSHPKGFSRSPSSSQNHSRMPRRVACVFRSGSLNMADLKYRAPANATSPSTKPRIAALVRGSGWPRRHDNRSRIQGSPRGHPTGLSDRPCED